MKGIGGYVPSLLDCSAVQHDDHTNLISNCGESVRDGSMVGNVRDGQTRRAQTERPSAILGPQCLTTGSWMENVAVIDMPRVV